MKSPGADISKDRRLDRVDYRGVKKGVQNGGREMQNAKSSA